jgi:hypothetical protein
MDEPDNAPARESVRLRHPHTGDMQEVEATPEKLVPWMGLGYVQVSHEQVREVNE